MLIINILDATILDVGCYYLEKDVCTTEALVVYSADGFCWYFTDGRDGWQVACCRNQPTTKRQSEQLLPFSCYSRGYRFATRAVTGSYVRLR